MNIFSPAVPPGAPDPYNAHLYEEYEKIQATRQQHAWALHQQQRAAMLGGKGAVPPGVVGLFNRTLYDRFFCGSFRHILFIAIVVVVYSPVHQQSRTPLVVHEFYREEYLFFRKTISQNKSS